jgi:hypothetical protein
MFKSQPMPPQSGGGRRPVKKPPNAEYDVAAAAISTQPEANVDQTELCPEKTIRDGRNRDARGFQIKGGRD